MKKTVFNFNDLKPNYVVFICCFDPFGGDLYRYTFTNRCAENGWELNDGTVKIFLNTKGKNKKDVPKELVHFLEYVENSTDECVAKQNDNAIHHIHQRVANIKKSREWEQKYMRFEELLQKEYTEGLQRGHDEGFQEGHHEGLQEGHHKGLQEGIQTMITLTQKLLETGETDKIPMLSDENFLNELCLKYGIFSAITHNI